MRQLCNYLFGVKGDVFKLLPMRESFDEGNDNYLDEYLETLLVNMKGSLITYPVLNDQKQYLYVINSLQYLADKGPEVKFELWRRIILNSMSNIGKLIDFFKRGDFNARG